MRLYGKRPVIERLKKAPQTIRSLHIQQNIDASDVVQAANAARIKFSPLNRAELVRMAGEVHSQGVIAEVDDFRYTPVEEIIAAEPKPVLLLLDRVTDPQNLGAILRTTACLGGTALVIPKHDSADVNETVLRVACGGENYVPVAQVTNLATASEQLKKAGYWIAGAAAEGGTPLPEVNWPLPVAVVLGSEGSGIRPGLVKHLDLTVTLPMRGAGLSFNVATAAALIAYEIQRTLNDAAKKNVRR